ncbi:hypothetical protein B0H13DRAFT_2289442 [Mycena leptocephala]|nr:hypothetical protein B0H13DRAFT_2289442 [Mycena leptocephala]
MVLGFFKHVYRYFQSRDEKPRQDAQSQLGQEFQPHMIPCYDESGQIIAYRSVINPSTIGPTVQPNNAPGMMSDPRYNSPPMPVQWNLGPDPTSILSGAQPGPRAPMPIPPSTQLPNPYYWTPPWGFTQPYPHSTNPPPVPDPANVPANQQPDQTPFNVAPSNPRPQSVSSSSSSKHSPSLPNSSTNSTAEGAKSRSKAKVSVDWDLWPDGYFEQDW